MSSILPIMGVVLKLAGAIFLLAAALGVLRFKDVLQRMHAATKAGTIGAGLVVLGSFTGASDVETIIIGQLAIAFLLFTAPVRTCSVEQQTLREHRSRVSVEMTL